MWKPPLLPGGTTRTHFQSSVPAGSPNSHPKKLKSSGPSSTRLISGEWAMACRSAMPAPVALAPSVGPARVRCSGAVLGANSTPCDCRCSVKCRRPADSSGTGSLPSDSSVSLARWGTGEPRGWGARTGPAAARSHPPAAAPARPRGRPPARAAPSRSSAPPRSHLRLCQGRPQRPAAARRRRGARTGACPWASRGVRYWR